MTDKEKILAEIERQIELNNNIDPITIAQKLIVDSVNVVLTDLLNYGKSLPKEPVSEDMEKAAKRYATEGDEISSLYIIDEEVEAFKHGAQWQREQMMAKTIDVTLYPNDKEIWVDVFEDLKDFDEGERAKIIILK